MCENFPDFTFLQSSEKFLARKGGLRATISYRTHPSDQMSVLKLYGRLSHISGET
jgi:hypothetical protein